MWVAFLKWNDDSWGSLYLFTISLVRVMRFLTASQQADTFHLRNATLNKVHYRRILFFAQSGRW